MNFFSCYFLILNLTKSYWHVAVKCPTDFKKCCTFQGTAVLTQAFYQGAAGEPEADNPQFGADPGYVNSAVTNL